MGILLYIGIFVVSLTVLLYASDRFVDSAEGIGLSIGVSPFIIGVTIVAFGTSLPELATSIASVYSGSSEIVVGNVIGSNITNILLVLGMTAYIGKDINLDFDVMDIDMPLLFGSAFLMYFTLSDFHFSYFEIFLYLVGLAIFLINSFQGDKAAYNERPKVFAKDYIVLIIAAVMVYLGADYTIYAIEHIAIELNVDPHIIALTAVALGTSLPELIVSVAASRKGKHAMAVGNVLGSNIFNTYAVMGISGLFGEIAIPQDASFEIIFMVVVTVLFGMICLGGRVSRWEGATLVLFYFYFLGESLKGVI